MCYTAQQIEAIAIPHYRAVFDDWGFGQMALSSIIADGLNNDDHFFAKSVTALDTDCDDGPRPRTITADKGYLFVYPGIKNR